jgi:hypothetical protein
MIVEMREIINCCNQFRLRSAPVNMQIPVEPIERRSPHMAAASARSCTLYWLLRSALSRIRLNADYAEVCVKPRICGDGLRSWGVLADFSA